MGVRVEEFGIGKVSRLYPPNEGSSAGWPPVRLEPRTHSLRGWIIDFPSQVPRRLLDYPELCRLRGVWNRV